MHLRPRELLLLQTNPQEKCTIVITNSMSCSRGWDLQPGILSELLYRDSEAKLCEAPI